MYCLKRNSGIIFCPVSNSPSGQPIQNWENSVLSFTLSSLWFVVKAAPFRVQSLCIPCLVFPEPLPGSRLAVRSHTSTPSCSHRCCAPGQVLLSGLREGHKGCEVLERGGAGHSPRGQQVCVCDLLRVCIAVCTSLLGPEAWNLRARPHTPLTSGRFLVPRGYCLKISSTSL